MKVKVPLDDSSIKSAEYNDNEKDTHGFGSERQRIEVETKINHHGEVNRARMMPQKTNIVATKTILGEVHIFDYHKHPMVPENDEVKPEMKLTGHTKEGYGLSWNPNLEGVLLSGSDDTNILIWDLNKKSSVGSQFDKFSEHESVVEDVAWNRQDQFIFGSVGDDKKLKVWDTRQSKSVSSVDAHTEEAICLDFSYYNPNMILTGSCDKTVAMWDRRKPESALHLFKQHSEEVNCVKYHPHHENLFASASTDRRAIVWDVSMIGSEQSEEEKKDGPPEMMFMHGGHTAKITDLSWNPNERNTIASVAEDNIVQVWQIAKEIHYDDPEHMAS